MKNFLNSLLSRKFLLAVASFLTFLASGQYDLALYTVLAYLGVEGSADALERYKSGSKVRLSTKVSDADGAEAVDTSEIWTGATAQRHVDDIINPEQ